METKEPGITEKTLKELGKIFPGLDSLVNIAKSSPAFRERLKEKDEEIEKRLRGETQTEFKRKKESQNQPAREPQVDIFDEGDYLRIIVELPGVEEKDIVLQQGENLLQISAGKFSHKIPLPFHIEQNPEYSYRNGILVIKVVK